MNELVEFWGNLGFLEGVDENKKNALVKNIRKQLII